MRLPELFGIFKKKAEKLSSKNVKTLIGIYPRKQFTHPKAIDETPIEKWVGDFVVDNFEIESLVGSPYEVTGNYDCGDNKLISFEGISPIIGRNIHASNNKFESLKDIEKHIKKMKGVLLLMGCPIKSHVLGLLKIDGLRGVGFDTQFVPSEVNEILNRHLKNGKDLLDCQSELIDAGFYEYAKY